MKPSPLTNEQTVKIIEAALYVGLSAIVSFLISQIADNPDLFGPLTPVVNVVLVSLKQVFTRG